MSAQTKPAADMVEILIAEDSRTQAEQLKYLLERHHYSVTVAYDGQQALALLGEHKPALVITDIVMPEMNGYELCQRIKADESTQDIPVILLTTLSNPEDVLEGLACGADNFITKPYSKEVLLLHIAQILANKRLGKNERVRVGVEILFAGKRRFITANQQQMLTLLISTYEAAVNRNTELLQAQNELRSLNEHLEDLVEERTAALVAEITERKRAEEEIGALARFPSENPNPVLRIARDGKLLFINEAGLVQLHEWHLQAGQPVPSVLWEVVSRSMDSGSTLALDLEHGERVYSFSVAPIADAGYANLYGYDITEHKRAEETLATERSLLRTLVDHLPDAVYVKDVACRKTLANPADFRNMGAASEAEVLGKTDFDLFPPDLAALFYADDQLVIQSGQPILNREEEVTQADGTRGWQLTSKVPVRDGADQVVGLVGIGHDITARVQAEETVRWAEQRYHSLFEEAPVMYVITRSQGGIPVVTDCNQSFLSTLGYARAEVTGRPLADLYTPRSRAELLEGGGYQRALEGHLAPEERQLLTRDGCVVETLLRALPETDLEGNTIGSRAMYVDITARKRAEEALRESERKLRTLFEIVPVGISILNAEGKMVYINPALERILDLSREGVFTGDYQARQYLRPDGTPMTGQELASVRAVHEQRMVHDVETGVMREDGSVIWTSVSAAPVTFADWKVIVVTADITARKQAEQVLQLYAEQLEAMVEDRTRELREAQEQLVSQERLAVLGQLAGGVGHELRNPLGAIKNASYFLDMVVGKTDPDVSEVLEILTSEVAASDRIITSLLDFAHVKAPRRREVNLNQVVSEALGCITIPAAIRVECALDESLPPIQADPDHLKQVFDHIIRNAVQAMPEGGQLTIQTMSLDQSVGISFTDTGVGIPPENLDKVFEPLFSTKTTGIGLGLPLAKSLTEGHGGCVEVTSEVGKGSTFTVRLPIE